MLKFRNKEGIILSVLIAIIILVIANRYQVTTQRKYFSQLNLSLTAVVDSAHYLKQFNGSGILHTRIISSNIQYYDVRKEQPYYYCIIKNGVADIIESHADEFMAGDTILVNSKDESVVRIRKGKENMKFVLWVNTDPELYN